MHYLLLYEKAADHESREPPFQPAHRAHVFAAIDRGELVLGGPLLEPCDGSNLLLFRTDSADVVESFARNDPFVQHQIVSNWQVRPWQTVVGADAASPLPRQSP